MIMQTIDPVVANRMQNNMHNAEGIVTAMCIHHGIYHSFGLLCVYENHGQCYDL